MQNSLMARRKLGFIDGSIAKPASTDPVFMDWQTVNSMIVGWIIKSIDESLRSSISYPRSAKVLWDDLQQRFSVGNGPRKLQLRHDITTCRQGGQSVSSYFSTLKKLWEEIDIYAPATACTCGAAAALLQEREEERAHQFLIGLNDTAFCTVRSNILAQDPLPSIGKIYSLIIQEERHRTVVTGRESTIENPAFSARSLPSAPKDSPQFVSKKNLVCSHCGKKFHDVSTCYKLHGLPPGFKDKAPAGRGSLPAATLSDGLPSAGHGSGKDVGTVHAVQSSPGASSSAPGASLAALDCQAFGPPLTNDQWSAVLNMFNSMNTASANKLGNSYEDGDWHG